MDRLKLKNKAKESMQGHYWEAIKMLLVFVFIAIVTGFIAGLLDAFLHTTWVLEEKVFMGQVIQNKISLFQSIGEIVLTGLFTLGIISFFLKISRNEEVTYQELFSKTKYFIFFIVATVLVSIFVTLWSLLLIIPGIIAALSYSMVMLIKLDNPEIGVLDAIKKSKELMNGHKWDYFVLQLSFLGWIILGMFTLGILYIWLIPYMTVTECNFYNELIKTN